MPSAAKRSYPPTEFLPRVEYHPRRFQTVAGISLRRHPVIVGVRDWPEERPETPCRGLVGGWYA